MKYIDANNTLNWWKSVHRVESFSKPTISRPYIKILLTCLAPASMAVIYPGVKHPMNDQVNSLCVKGYLDRLKDTETHRYVYKTTKAGIDLIFKAIHHTK